VGIPTNFIKTKNIILVSKNGKRIKEAEKLLYPLISKYGIDTVLNGLRKILTEQK
jgi:molybdopterin-guanine dinucleotide biosynthesis protein A